MSAHIFRTSALMFCAGLLTVACSGNPVTAPRLSHGEHQTLQAMSQASTWGHPDLSGQFNGMQAYARGDYANALKYFKYGARYADKLSQLSIGLMYLNGRGVKKDPVTAWAWLALAAERDYPKFASTRDSVWKNLDDTQRQRARRVHEQLAATYGDKVAKVRMRHALQYWRTQITGSRTGFDSGVKHVDKARFAGNGAGNSACMRQSAIMAPISGCGGNIYAKWRWDPKTYFALKDSRWTGTVSVGALEDVGSPDEPAKPDTEKKK